MVFGALMALLIGISLGLLGGGGSILTVPILLYVFHLPTREAIATSLLVVGTTSLAAVIPHARAGRVQWRTGAIFGATSMIGAFIAGRLAKHIPAAILLLATPWRLMELRAISLVLFRIGAIFTIYLRYVEQAHFGGHVCAWCVAFMAFWWIAGACELLRLVRQLAPALLLLRRQHVEWRKIRYCTQQVEQPDVKWC
jgi:uncharacterized membrane protein YfcA